MVGAGSICTLIAGMSVISPDVRSQLANAMAGDAPSQLSALASRAQEYGHLVLRTARDLSPDNTPLLGFAIVAVVLGVLMFRT